MNVDQARLEESWMVELHPKGGSQIRMVRDVLAEKRELLLRGELPEWQEVAVRESYDDARKELARIRKQMRSAQSVTEIKKPDAQKQTAQRDHGFDQAGDPIFGVYVADELSGTGEDQESKPVTGSHPQQGGDEFDQNHRGSIA